MSKPQPIRIPSDECTVTVGGIAYQPHEGEWVELLPGYTVAEVRLLNTLRTAGVRMQAAQGEANEQAETLQVLDEVYDEILLSLARRVTAWSWTDDRGQPLPAPDGTAAPFGGLRPEEVNWLLSAVQGETAQARGKGSKPSPTSSLATPPTPIRTPSTSARSRGRA